MYKIKKTNDKIYIKGNYLVILSQYLNIKSVCLRTICFHRIFNTISETIQVTIIIVLNKNDIICKRNNDP